MKNKFKILFRADLDGINHGTASASYDPNFYNSFPAGAPKINATGIYAQEVEITNLMPYAIDIYQDFQMHERPKYPMYTFFAFQGGETVYVDDILYTDAYEGNDSFDIPFDAWRLRDIWGDGTAASASNNPIAIGNSAEIGGMKFVQRAYIGPKSKANMNVTDFDAIKDNDLLWVETPTTAWNDPTHAYTYPGTSLGVGARNVESAFVRDSSGSAGKNLVLAWRRTRASTDKYSNTVGDPDDFIRKMENVLANGDYQVKELDCYVNGTSATEKVYSYKYVSGSSKLRFLPIQNSTLCEQLGASVAFEDYIHTLVGISQFIYNAARNMSILILNYEMSAITNDVNASTASITGNGAGSQLTDSRYYIVTKGPTTFGAAVTLTDGTTCGIGQIFLSQTTATDVVATGAEVALVTNGMLLEEVNTSATTKRIFGYGYDSSTNKHIGGMFSPESCVVINRHRDVVDPKSPLGGFESEKKGFYNWHVEEHVNYVQIFRSKTWTVGVQRQNTKLKIDMNDIERSRMKHIDEFKRDIYNRMCWGKKSKVRDSDGEIIRGMGGIFDRELNPGIKYLYMPIPITGGVIDESEYENYMEKLAQALHYNRTPGDYQDRTVLFVGLKILHLLGKANAVAGIGTTAAGGAAHNPFGMNFEGTAPSELTFGLPVYKFKTIFGSLELIYNPGFDFETGFEVPYYLFPNHSGKLDPRYLAVALDPGSIKFYTRAGYEEKVHGNLQPSNNPNIYTEGIQAGHSITIRNGRDNTILYMPPRY